MKHKKLIIALAGTAFLLAIFSRPIAQTLTYAALQVANTFTVLQTFSSGIVVSPSTATPGNRIGLAANDTLFTLDPDCTNSGTANELTILDRDETAADDWTLCDGTGQLFDIPNTGSDVVADTQLLVGGTTAGTATWVTMSGDATISNAGALTVTAVGNNVKVEEFDTSPSLATTRTLRFPNGSLSTTFEATNAIRFILNQQAPPVYLSGLRVSSNVCLGKYDNNQALTLNILYLAPFYIAEQTTLDALGFRLGSAGGTGAADFARLGIYDSTSAGLPGALKIQATGSGLSIQTNDASVEDTGIAPTALDPGWYWFGYIGQATATMRGRANDTCATMGASSVSAGDTNPTTVFTTASTYAGGLPDPVPALVLADITVGVFNPPYFWYRIQ